MEENHHHHHHLLLLRPLLRQSTATNPPVDTPNPVIPPSSNIVLRLSFVAFIGIVSVWANHEASRGYSVTVINGAHDTLPGKRFQLFYASNDEATRVLLRASHVIRSVLYLNSDSQKPVSRIVLKLAGRNLTDDVVVRQSPGPDEFVVEISPSVMESLDFGEAMNRAVGKGIVRVWLWDGWGRAPENLVNGIVELMAGRMAGPRAVSGLDSAGACWRSEDPRAVSEFLRYCEGQAGPGFLRRLNMAMKDGWKDGTLGAILGQPEESLCGEYHESLGYNVSSA